MYQTPYGENNPNAKLTDAQVELIRNLRAGEATPGVKRFWTLGVLARKFEVSRRTICYILSGQRRP